MKFRYAFSMIELIMVIVVMGLLASLAIPRIERDVRQEAIDSIVSNMQLAKRMALSDHQHNSNSNLWQKSYWQWRVTDCSASDKIFYIVGKNSDYNNEIDQNESAIDPYNQKYLHHTNLFCGKDATINKDSSSMSVISEKFGISSVVLSGGCAGGHHVAFDELGRPHSGIYSYLNVNYEFLMQNDCLIKFNFSDGGPASFTIRVAAISGRLTVE